jgi:enoyl-CoA hydratase
MSLNDYKNLNVALGPRGLLHIILNRPDKLNALNEQLLNELQHVLNLAKTDAGIKALLITGSGEKAFCAGADLQAMVNFNAEEGLAFAERGQAVFRNLEQLGKPSLAAIQGYALGGGCELAMAATLRIATNTAQFGQPEIKLGLIPGYGGTQRLARLIGKGRALDLCLTGRNISAQDALAFGLISEIVEPAQLQKRAEAILDHLMSLAPLALASIMQVIDTGYDLTLDEALRLEAIQFGFICASEDKREGITAFLEKRTPHFVGR